MTAPAEFPAVTAIINTFERAQLLDRALTSIAAQLDTFDDFEVIVVDDASNDAGATAAVIDTWSKRFTERGIAFGAVAMPENSGAQAAPKNAGIQLARGDYIRFLDDDNEWTPGSLRALYDSIESGDIWVDLVYGRREYVLDEGASPFAPDGETKLPVGPSPLVEHNPERLASGPLWNYIDTSDFIISRGAFWWLAQHTGWMWQPNRRRFGDWELVTRAANLDKLVGRAPIKMRALDAIVQRYHWHNANLQLTRAHDGVTPEAVTLKRVESQR